MTGAKIEAKEEWRNMSDLVLSTYDISSVGRIRNIKTGEMLKLQLRQGYQTIHLGTDIETRKFFLVHRLVAAMFIPNTEHKPTVDHINRIRDDNRVENLRWADASEQSANQTTTPARTYRSIRVYFTDNTFKVFARREEITKELKLTKYHISDSIRLGKVVNGYLCKYDDLYCLLDEQWKKMIRDDSEEIWASTKGRIYLSRAIKATKGSTSTSGYKIVSALYNGKMRGVSVHRLIMEVYNGSSDLQVNHKDGNKLNNCLENLEYVTPSENIKHA